MVGKYSLNVLATSTGSEINLLFTIKEEGVFLFLLLMLIILLMPFQVFLILLALLRKNDWKYIDLLFLQFDF